MKVFAVIVLVLGCAAHASVGDSGDSDSREPDAGTRRNSGALFNRWGRKDCPDSSELVYTGVAAGAHFTHKGSGSNYLCLPDEPIYENPVPGSQTGRGLIYGAEYESARNSDDLTPYTDLDDYNTPCALCQATNRASMAMIPARNECPSSKWTKEYSGYIMSQSYQYYRSEFICMDGDPQPIPRSNYNANGALFYPVEGRCGTHGSGLPCGPYINGNELTCAVCTI